MLRTNNSSIKYSARIIAVCIVLALSASTDVFAVSAVKAHGMLTSVEDDGTVIINGKGYLVAPSAIVHDAEGYSIALSRLSSRYVNFEYEYGKNGFEIIFIQEVPQ